MTENKKQNIQLLSAKELAGKLLLSARTVWRLRSAGRLPKSVCIGGSVRWRQSDIEQWIELGCCSLKTFEAMQNEGGEIC